MKVSLLGGVRLVLFVARDVLTNLPFALAVSNATSTAAVRALRYLYEQAPAAVKSIQVDGGSEFKGQFEQQCQADNIPLFVIPPRSPRHNSKVENANGMIRQRILNFHNDYETTIAGTRKTVGKHLDLYNTHRPNLALPMIEDRGVKRLFTPMEYTLALLNSSQAPPPATPPD